MNQTNGAKAYVQQQLGNTFRAHLSNGNMTAASLKTSPQLTTVITNMYSNLTYPPTEANHRQAISHQIATGGATPYNSKNATVKIQMDPNAPVDPCLGLPKITCYGNLFSNPYCKNDCTSR
jgi:hypothetical protein